MALLGQLFFHVHFKNSLSVFSPKLKKQTGWAWFDHDSVGHLERISVIILGLLIHEHVICLSLSPFNVLIKFYNHQRDPEHCMYKYIYSFLCKSYFRCYIYIYTHTHTQVYSKCAWMRFCHFLFKKNFKPTEKFEEVKWTFLIPFNQVHFPIVLSLQIHIYFCWTILKYVADMVLHP